MRKGFFFFTSRSLSNGWNLLPFFLLRKGAKINKTTELQAAAPPGDLEPRGGSFIKFGTESKVVIKAVLPRRPLFSPYFFMEGIA